MNEKEMHVVVYKSFEQINKAKKTEYNFRTQSAYELTQRYGFNDISEMWPLLVVYFNACFFLEIQLKLTLNFVVLGTGFCMGRYKPYCHINQAALCVNVFTYKSRGLFADTIGKTGLADDPKSIFVQYTEIRTLDLRRSGFNDEIK